MIYNNVDYRQISHSCRSKSCTTNNKTTPFLSNYAVNFTHSSFSHTNQRKHFYLIMKLYFCLFENIKYEYNIIIFNIFFINLKNLKSFCEKRDAFDCAGIRAPVFRSPVDCSNQMSYTCVRHLLLHGKTCLYRCLYTDEIILQAFFVLSLDFFRILGKISIIFWNIFLHFT